MPYLGILILLTVLGAANFYLAHRTWRWLHCIIPKLSIFIVLLFFVLMTVVMFLSIANPFSGALQRILSAVGAGWMGIFAYLILFFLLADLVVLIPGLFRLLSASAMAKLRLAAGITATALALSVSLYGFCHAQRLYTVEYTVQLSNTPASEMNIVVISDVHLGAVGSEARLQKIVDQINQLSPDLVCIAGDFFDTDFRTIADPERAIETMLQIQSQYGVYACLGNHDSGKTLPAMEAFFDRANVTLLKDTYAVIDGRLLLAGRLDSSPINGAGELRRGELAAVLDDADPTLPVVMLDHNPAHVDTYRGEVDLILSGHTHKGQIFPGELVTDAMHTVDYGYYCREDGLQVIVTSGAGIWGLPMRVGTDCEIVWIHLKI